MKLGVLAVQGAVEEHVEALRLASPTSDVVLVRRSEDLQQVAGLILPGGESTTISRLLRSAGLQEPMRQRGAAGDLAIFGTCAGLILLCSKAPDDGKDVELLGLLEAEADRNAFGRQVDSFESALDVVGIGKVPAVFIRAPVVGRVWGTTEALARTREGIVALRRGNVLATAFHPELTGDLSLHRLFVGMAAEAAGATDARANGPAQAHPNGPTRVRSTGPE